MTDATGAAKRSTLDIAGATLEIHEIGIGPPVLFLHGGSGPAPRAPFFAMLGARHRVIMPTHPGFGGSSLPGWLDSCDDIAHIHLELMDRLGISRTALVGASIGGWIALEMATKSPERFTRLGLIAPVGVKVGSVDKLDIPDMFAVPPAQLQAMLFHAPEKFKPDLTKLDDEALMGMVKAREMLALLAWEPYMHNPKLPHRLHRIACPALFLRGASDGLVSAEYTSAYAELIANAKVETIAAAGHVPQIEQPEATSSLLLKHLA